MALIFKHFPLESIHIHARPLAELAACAAEQDQFWPVHDFLFEPSTVLSMISAEYLASRLPLSVEALRVCAADAGRTAVDADVSQAAELGVSSTPQFVMGVMHSTGVDVRYRIRGAASATVFRGVLEELARSR